MNHKKLKIGLLLFFLFLAFTIIGLGVYTYRGIFLGEEYSPNKEYLLRYYSSFDPFSMYWSMPGGTACKRRWVRLYNKEGNKLNEIYTTDCALENQAQWLDTELILPDGNTVWVLPGNAR